MAARLSCFCGLSLPCGADEVIACLRDMNPQVSQLKIEYNPTGKYL